MSNLEQHFRQSAVLMVSHRYRRPVYLPLIVRLEIQAHDIDNIFAPAQLRFDAAQQHVVSFELPLTGVSARPRSLRVRSRGAIWIRGSAQTNLQAGSISRIARTPAMAVFTRCRLNHPRLFGPTREIADLNSPCEKGDLVDGTQQRRCSGDRTLYAHGFCRERGIGIDEMQRSLIDMVWRSAMEDVPDNLDTCRSGRLDHWRPT